MDIHKPKPWHGFREFLKEYLIIVVGVLTALASEQAVEWLHWQERTRQTEEHLRSELHWIALQAVAQVAINKCDNDMIDRIEAALVASGDEWTPPYVFTAGGLKGLLQSPKSTYTSQAWRNAQADGSANHLPQAEQEGFGQMYESAARAKAIADQEEADMAELNSLATIRRLDTGTRSQYLRLIWRVRQDLLDLRITSQGLVSAAADLKVKRARIEEYTPVAWNLYQRACRGFYSGQPVIQLDLPEGPHGNP